MGEGTERKKPLDIDWKVIFDDDTPVELEIVRSDQSSDSEELEITTDRRVDQTINRLAMNINNLSSKFSSEGVRLPVKSQRLEQDKNQRSLFRLQADKDCKNATQSQRSSHSGAYNGSSLVCQSSQATSKSGLTSCVVEILERKSDASACVGGDAFAKEFSYLCSADHQETRQSRRWIHEENRSRFMTSRDFPFKFANIDGHDKDRQRLLNGRDQKGTAPSSLFHQEVNMSGHFKKRKSSQLQSSIDSCTRKGQSCQDTKQGQRHQTVVLVDEEDCPVETTLQKEQPTGRCKDIQIYYPSRNDPESVELSYSDIDCLAPEHYLSSTIMNFYIRYLRRPVSPTGRQIGDYYFFNTYFYEKLKEAISYKSQKDAFVKFRRWWKGVNIFQKAYILLPIHEKQHWSLVIICNPPKDEESGQIILLHLDSLGCHMSSEIFENIRRFLKEEWKYINDEVAPQDHSFGDKEWRKLQDKIIDRIITVPQQKNVYDCGIFVLYFMERFIEEAPERITNKNVSMFGEHWFKPEEASRLRGRIRELLDEEFENAKIEDLTMESSSDSD